MKAKLANKFLGAVIAPLLFVFLSGTAASQVVVPVGKTEEQSSQLVLWYDDNLPITFIQVTNASVDTPVNVHVQIFATFGVEAEPTDILVLCQETDFNDFYTPNDTHFYDMDEVFRNADFDSPGSPQSVGGFQGTKGFIVITPIDAPGTRNAIAHQHMFGNTLMDFGYGLNAMGRDAVSFSTGNVVPDGTVLDGVANGYVLIQPEILKFNFLDFESASIVSIAFRDNYEGVFGYVAEPGDALWTPLIFDELENPVSCSPVPQNCFFDTGVNDFIDAFNELFPIVAGLFSVCPANNFVIGWMKIAVSGLEGLENELGIAAFDGAFASWMYVEGAATPIEPLPECTVDADCAEGEVCEAGDCVEAPECAVDADCAEGEECVAGDCVEAPECTVDADCAAGQVCALGICIADPEGGGGGGCAIASTATAGSAAANALVVLIPLLGIGLRSILRRREED